MPPCPSCRSPGPDQALLCSARARRLPCVLDHPPFLLPSCTFRQPLRPPFPRPVPAPPLGLGLAVTSCRSLPGAHAAGCPGRLPARWAGSVGTADSAAPPACRAALTERTDKELRRVSTGLKRVRKEIFFGARRPRSERHPWRPHCERETGGPRVKQVFTFIFSFLEQWTCTCQSFPSPVSMT